MKVQRSRVETTVVDVRSADDVGHARRLARWVGLAREATSAEADRIALVATEMATNLAMHAGGGRLIVQNLDETTQLSSCDSGPGIEDLPAMLKDGATTASTPGVGLGVIQRQGDSFSVFTRPKLTVVQSSIGQSASEPQNVATMHAPKPGELHCGDAWVVVDGRGKRVVALFDGLGHGVSAAAASAIAIDAIVEDPFSPVSELLHRAHGQLRENARGAVGAIAHFDGNTIEYAAVGNIDTRILRGDGRTERLITKPGVLGRNMPRLMPQRYVLDSHDILLLASDGLRTSWRVSDYKGLLGKPLSLIAAVLHFDLRSGRDDSSILLAGALVP